MMGRVKQRGGNWALLWIALAAMSGQEKFEAIHSTAFKGIGHHYMLEPSERPEGPWLLDYFEISELRDFDKGRLRQEIKSKGCNSTECWKSAALSLPLTLVVRDGVAATQLWVDDLSFAVLSVLRKIADRHAHQKKNENPGTFSKFDHL